jgi:hypothetical protein
MGFANPSYFIKISSGDQRGVMFYQNQNITVVWDRNGQNQGQFPGNQLNKQGNTLETAGYQLDSNPGWQVPTHP